LLYVTRGLDPSDWTTYRRTQQTLAKQQIVLDSALESPEAQKLPSVQADRPKVRSWLERDLNCDFGTSDQSSAVMNISLVGPDPEEVIVLVNAVKEAYLQASRKEET